MNDCLAIRTGPKIRHRLLAGRRLDVSAPEQSQRYGLDTARVKVGYLSGTSPRVLRELHNQLRSARRPDFRFYSKL